MAVPLVGIRENKQATIANRKDKLPSSKPILRQEEISRFLPKVVLRKCSKMVTTLQGKHKALKEVEIVLEAPNAGTFPAETLRRMRNYHHTIDTIGIIDKAIAWVDTIYFCLISTSGSVSIKTKVCWMA